ncbi:HK97 family phage prohead protease [Nocardia sp. NPDC055165]
MRVTEQRRAERPPIEQVLREAPFSLRAVDEDDADDGLTLDGYGAVFNRETIIDSWEGKFREVIAPGSMKRSFRETPPKVQFDHGHHPLIGSIPIAQLETIREDTDPVLAPDGGAHVIGRIFDNWLMQPVRDAIKGKAINGMSFRFSVVREAWADANGTPIRDEAVLREKLRETWYEDIPDEELLVRTLKELKVPEIGPVVWPAYAETSVSVRSKVIDLAHLDDPEQRKLLARAVFLADMADTAPQQPTAPAVGERPVSDAQRSTPSVGERPSSPQRGQRPIDLWVRKSRDVLLNIEQKGKRK